MELSAFTQPKLVISIRFFIYLIFRKQPETFSCVSYNKQE